MSRRNRLQTLIPKIWLISDARNDAVLERAIARLPRRSGVIFLHHHLPLQERRARFARIARLCRARGVEARMGYGHAIAKAHTMRELRQLDRRAQMLLLSQVFATRSHSGAATLGAIRFLLMARHARLPVCALGGMTRASARRLMAAGIHGWAAIDGLSLH